jgi:hypothetical protein
VVIRLGELVIVAGAIEAVDAREHCRFMRICGMAEGNVYLRVGLALV